MGEAGDGCHTPHTQHAICWKILTRQKNDIFPVLHFFGKQCLWMGFESFSVTKMSILKPRLGPMHNSIPPHQPHISGWKSPTLKITGRIAPGRLRVTQEHPKCHKILKLAVDNWYKALWCTLWLFWHLWRSKQGSFGKAQSISNSHAMIWLCTIASLFVSFNEPQSWYLARPLWPAVA